MFQWSTLRGTTRSVPDLGNIGFRDGDTPGSIRAEHCGASVRRGVLLQRFAAHVARSYFPNTHSVVVRHGYKTFPIWTESCGVRLRMVNGPSNQLACSVPYLNSA